MKKENCHFYHSSKSNPSFQASPLKTKSKQTNNPLKKKKKQEAKTKTQDEKELDTIDFLNG